jgi:hypothetical protein
MHYHFVHFFEVPVPVKYCTVSFLSSKKILTRPITQATCDYFFYKSIFRILVAYTNLTPVQYAPVCQKGK